MNLALLIASVLGAAVQGISQIPTSIKQLLQAITLSLTGIIHSGVTTSLNPTTILAALAGVIASLKAIQGVPAETLAIIAGLEDAITAALAADVQASKQVDPTQLQPIAPVA